MIKKGFTLAEVLITLAIIGVVATLTLPTLMTNTAEQQYTSAFKKVVNTLSEAGQMNLINVGFGYSGLPTSVSGLNTDALRSAVYNDALNNDTPTAPDDAPTQNYNLYWLLSHNTSVLNAVSGLNTAESKKLVNDAEANFVVFFNDGTALSVPTGDGNFTDTKQQIKAMVDINGNKGPNTYSNCSGTDAMITAPTSATIGTACSKDTARIKDRYGVILEKGRAIPNGKVSQYAFGDK